MLRIILKHVEIWCNLLLKLSSIAVPSTQGGLCLESVIIVVCRVAG